MTVALDSDAKVATSYHVEAIPMLVLVDKKGTVQSVHVGYNPGIKATLRSELDDSGRQGPDQGKGRPRLRQNDLER